MAAEAVPESATQVLDPSVSSHDEDSASSGSHTRSPASDEQNATPSEASKRPQQTNRRQNDGPPLPEEDVPPLPDEAPPAGAQDDGWAPVWDDNAQAYYFFNRFTGLTQWTNPRVPEVQPTAPGVGNYDRIPDATLNVEEQQPARPYGGYDPAIHGDYDPTASYAQEAGDVKPDSSDPADPNAIYTATGVFNRFTGKWQPTTLAPENFNDENKSKRQMSAFFDVDAAANSHNGKSLKAERSGKKLTKQELKAFKEKRRDKKEEKRRAWLRD